jgi:hypothetical protein
VVVAGDVLSLDEGSGFGGGCGHGWPVGVTPMVIRVMGGGNFPNWDGGFRLGFALGGVPRVVL